MPSRPRPHPNGLLTLFSLLLVTCLASPALGADAVALHGWTVREIAEVFNSACLCGQDRIALGGRGKLGVRIYDLNSGQTTQLTSRNTHRVLHCTQDGRTLVYYDSKTSLSTPYYLLDLATGKTAKLYTYPGLTYPNVISPTQEYLIGQPDSEEYRDILTSIRHPLGHAPTDVFAWNYAGTVLYSIAATAGTEHLQRESLPEGKRESFALTGIEPDYAVRDIWPVDDATLLIDAELTSTDENDPRPDTLNYTATLRGGGIAMERTGRDIWRVVSGNGRIFRIDGARQNDTATDVYVNENGQDVHIAQLSFPVTPNIKASPDGDTLLLIERVRYPLSGRIVMLRHARP